MSASSLTRDRGPGRGLLRKSVFLTVLLAAPQVAAQAGRYGESSRSSVGDPSAASGGRQANIPVPSGAEAAAQDPETLAQQALQRLQQGQGWFTPDGEDSEEQSWWDDDGPGAGGAAELTDDAATDARGVDADQLDRHDAAREAADRATPDHSDTEPSVESLPTGEDRSAVKPQLIPTPSGEGKIEGMGESFAPQLNTGTASFSIPIALPPGRGGTQPGLSLGYASGGSNGILGIGWDIAVPFIARQVDKGMPTYRDPSAGYANDRFKYNGGQELVQVDPAEDETFQLPGGATPNHCTLSGGRCGPNDWLYFRARVEGAFLRFFMRGDGQQWRVQDKNGTWFIFGVVDGDAYVSSSRTEASLVSFAMNDGLSTEREVIYRWNLSEMTDASGNTVWYFYEHPTAGADSAQSYLRNIYWNSPVSADPVPENFEHHVELVYDRSGRQDVFTGYASGFPLTTAWRLNRIIVETVPFESAPGSGFGHTRTYLFTYDPDSYLSLLTGVQLFGKNCLGGSRTSVVTSQSGCSVEAGTALPPLTLGYTEVAHGVWADGFGNINNTVETFATSPDRSIDDDRTDLFDANRDGLPDLLITDPARCGGGHCLYINETDAAGRVSFVRTPHDVELPASVGIDFTMSNTNVNPLDMDGDGAVEWLHMPHSRSYRYFRLEHDDAPATSGDSWLDGYRWQEYGPYDPGTVDANLDFTRDASEIRLVDLNNDHLVDVVRTTGTEMQQWINLSHCGTEDDNYDGRFGTPIIDAYGQCIGAETDASGRDKPIATCVLHRGMPIMFDDASIKLADMNGDGLQDIVQLKSGDIAYWPGRGYVAGQAHPMFWGVSGDRESCDAGTYGPDLEQTMANSPHVLTLDDDARITLADANADGLTDMIQVRFNAVDVWLNLGGTAWSDRIILTGVPYHPGIVNRIRIADVNGSTTTDVMWGNGGDYKFLDFTGGIQPRLLVSVQNGMGKTSGISYRSSTAYAADARAAGTSWTSFAPFPSQVVASSTVTDGLGGSYVTQYKYTNAYYDGWEAEFRGYGEAEAKSVGDANSPTSVSVTDFEPGLMPEWACSDLATTTYPRGLLNPRCRFRENPMEALKGATTFTTTCDESRTICQGAATTRYSVRRLYRPAGSDRSVWYAYPKSSYSWVYDTSVLSSGSEDNFVGGYDIYDGVDEEAEELGSAAWPASVKTFSGNGHRYELASSVSEVDFWGNVGKTANAGALELTGDEVTAWAVYDQTLIDDLYIHRVRESWTNANALVDPEPDTDDPQKLGRTITTYPSSGSCRHLPAEVGVIGTNGFAWDDVNPAELDYVRSSAVYGAFCQPNQTCAGDACGGSPLGQSWVTYDTQYAAFPTDEVIDTSDPGVSGATPGATLTTSATWYAEYGAIHTAIDPSGLSTEVSLDTLGRPTKMYGPGCPEPKAEIEYDLGSPLSHVHTKTNETCESGSVDAVTGASLEAYAWVDGMGRARGAASEGSSTDGMAWIQSGFQTFDAKGAVQRAYLPSALSSPGSFSATHVPTSLYARSAYDAFGRVTRAWTTDGTEVVATSYGALATDIWDAGDLAPGAYSATPATTYVDGLGRTVRTIERNRAPGSASMTTYATDLVYNSLGAVVSMERGQLDGNDRSAAFASGHSVTKTQEYDTLGRRIRNHDPDAGLYLYAYDALDRLVATEDAREVINRYWYDRGGRLVAEDLRGEVPYNSTGWTAAGGSEGVTCPLDIYNQPVEPLPEDGCLDVIYGFDEEFDPPSEDWVGDLPTSGECAGYGPQGPLAGRPSWTTDRSGTVVLGYDCHGWAIWSERQVNPDHVKGYLSWSTFDEGQRLLNERHPDGSEFTFGYTSRGLLYSVQFTDSGVDPPVDRPLIRQTEYDAQGRRVVVVYGDQLCTLGSDPDQTCDPENPPEGDTCTCADEGTEETYSYDARQRLARKRAVRSDDLVLLDYRYSYDSASNIVRIDDDRLPYDVDDRLVPGFVPYDIQYEYDALYRLTKATPIYREPQPQRVHEQTWTFDELGSMRTWNDSVGHFYGWSLGTIINGLQAMQMLYDDPGVGALPIDPNSGCRLDAMGRCVQNRGGVAAPHAIYAAVFGSTEQLRAYYDAAGNMTALVVHRPLGCGREDVSGESTPAAGGPDGSGCREGANFRLLFAWDEVGNLLAVERQRLVDAESCTALGGGIPIQTGEQYLGPSPSSDYEWCPEARLESSYDFGGQRRLKQEINLSADEGVVPEGYSLYVSASYERREATWDGEAEEFDTETDLDARYLWNEAGILFELDAQAPLQGADVPKSRLTLTNQIGSASSVVDADLGSSAEILSQLPYGAEEQTLPRVGLDDPAAFAPRYELTGKERDRGVGLVYIGARSLDARLARWVSADPLATHGSLRNAYAYVAGNPIQLVDPTGLDDSPPPADPLNPCVSFVPPPDHGSGEGQTLGPGLYYGPQQSVSCGSGSPSAPPPASPPPSAPFAAPSSSPASADPTAPPPASAAPDAGGTAPDAGTVHPPDDPSLDAGNGSTPLRDSGPCAGGLCEHSVAGAGIGSGEPCETRIPMENQFDDFATQATAFVATEVAISVFGGPVIDGLAHVAVSLVRAVRPILGAERAADVATDVARVARACFPAGTSVLTESGLVAIEDIAPGTLVWSYDSHEAAWAWRMVVGHATHLFSGALTTIAVAGMVIEVTANHPVCAIPPDDALALSVPKDIGEDSPSCGGFGRWIEAGDIRVGDQLVSAAGVVVVAAVRSRTASLRVFNLTVVDSSTYAVGLSSILVHNKGAPFFRAIQSGGRTVESATAQALNEYAGTSLSAREWGRALEALKKAEGVPSSFHGVIRVNGDVLDDAGELIGNLVDYLP